MHKVFIVSVFSFLMIATSVMAQPQKDKESHDRFDDQRLGRLTSKEIERLKECKKLIKEVDQKSFGESLSKLETSAYPHENLQILEAVAQTYAEIVQEQNVVEQKNKEWLLTKIDFNMAYLQLAGLDVEQRNDTALNKMIRRKLRKNLPEDLKKHSDLFHLVE